MIGFDISRTGCLALITCVSSALFLAFNKHGENVIRPILVVRAGWICMM